MKTGRTQNKAAVSVVLYLGDTKKKEAQKKMKNMKIQHRQKGHVEAAEEADEQTRD